VTQGSRLQPLPALPLRPSTSAQQLGVLLP
jgi:hypothetical protein